MAWVPGRRRAWHADTDDGGRPGGRVRPPPRVLGHSASLELVRAGWVNPRHLTTIGPSNWRRGGCWSCGVTDELLGAYWLVVQVADRREGVLSVGLSEHDGGRRGSRRTMGEHP